MATDQTSTNAVMNGGKKKRRKRARNIIMTAEALKGTLFTGKLERKRVGKMIFHFKRRAVKCDKF